MIPVVVCALVGAFLGLWCPALIRRIPEPAPDPDPQAVPDSDPVAAPDAVPAPEAVPDPAGGPFAGAAVDPESGLDTDPEPATAVEPTEPKVLYAAIAAARGLALKTAVVSAAGGALLAYALGWHPALVFLVPLVPVLVALSVVDWRTQLLPTWVISRTYAVLVPLILVVGAVTGEWDDVFRAGWGWLITGGVFFVLWFINSAGLGYGDVRLSGIIGLVLGYLGWGELFAGVYSAFILGGVIGGVLALMKIVDRKGVPFGPFMVGGALLGVLLGPWTASHLG